MPYLPTAQSWLTQSTLLLQARPTTTRITTKYTLSHPHDPSAPAKKHGGPRKPKAATNEAALATASTPEPVRATLILKTYDPVSGATLKYSTTKAAEVGRLTQILGRLARPMAGLEQVREDVGMVDGSGVVGAGGEGGSGSGVATPVVEAAQAGKPVPVGGQGQGGKKGKKKGKK